MLKHKTKGLHCELANLASMLTLQPMTVEAACFSCSISKQVKHRKLSMGIQKAFFVCALITL